MGARTAPATGSMSTYSVEYSAAAAVPALRGRFGTESHDGSGTAGVLVSCVLISGAHGGLGYAIQVEMQSTRLAAHRLCVQRH
jgi:hypothetical protein